MADFEILRHGGKDHFVVTNRVVASGPEHAASQVVDPKRGGELILVRFPMGGGVTPFFVTQASSIATRARPADLVEL